MKARAFGLGRIWAALCASECRHRDGGALRASCHRVCARCTAWSAATARPHSLERGAVWSRWRCQRRTGAVRATLSTLAHIAPRFKSLPFLEELRAARRVRVRAEATECRASARRISQVSSMAVKWKSPRTHRKLAATIDKLRCRIIFMMCKISRESVIIDSNRFVPLLLTEFTLLCTARPRDPEMQPCENAANSE